MSDPTSIVHQFSGNVERGYNTSAGGHLQYTSPHGGRMGFAYTPPGGSSSAPTEADWAALDKATEPTNKAPVVRKAKLRLSEKAWLKLLLALEQPHEVSMMGISAADDPLFMEDFLLPRQYGTGAFTEFYDNGEGTMAELMFGLVDQGIDPSRVAGRWFHTHPAGVTSPSGTDWQTLDTKFGDHEWALMAIMPKNSELFAYLRINHPNFGLMTTKIDCDTPPENLLAALRYLRLPVPSNLDGIRTTAVAFLEEHRARHQSVSENAPTYTRSNNGTFRRPFDWESSNDHGSEKPKHGVPNFREGFALDFSHNDRPPQNGHWMRPNCVTMPNRWSWVPGSTPSANDLKLLANCGYDVSSFEKKKVQRARNLLREPSDSPSFAAFDQPGESEVANADAAAAYVDADDIDSFSVEFDPDGFFDSDLDSLPNTFMWDGVRFSAWVQTMVPTPQFLAALSNFLEKQAGWKVKAAKLVQFARNVQSCHHNNTRYADYVTEFLKLTD